MIYTASKLNGGLTMTAFVFSSTTFKQFYMRLKYLKQYTDSRKKQVEQLADLMRGTVNPEWMAEPKPVNEQLIKMLRMDRGE
jgi:hypothetical protein